MKYYPKDFKNKNYSPLLVLFLLLFVHVIWSQDQSFESAVPSNWSSVNGTLSISDDHYKLDSNSLQWNWISNGIITVTNLQSNGLVTSEVEGYHQNMFRMWVYNTVAISSEPLTVEFYDDEGNLQYFYEFQLNFEGWRAASASYKHEMSGLKSSDNITTMKIKAPSSGQGTLYFDYIDYTMERNIMRSADYQLPFLTKDNQEHWGDVMYYQTLAPTIPFPTPTAQELADLSLVKNEYDTFILGSPPNVSKLSEAIEDYDNLQISYTNGVVKGIPLYGMDYPNSQNISVVEDFLLTFARDVAHNNTIASKTYFTNTVRYLLDQGFADGSAMETMHHIGYQFRNIPAAIHLMKSLLETEGIWEQARNMVEWYVALDGIWEGTAASSNMDAANTRTVYRLGACLYTSSPEKQVAYLKGFRNYIENFLTSYAKTGQGLKIDYTGFHHNVYYPGYAYWGFNSLAKAIRFLSEGGISIDNTKREVLKKSILLARLVTASGDIPNSLSGRNAFKNASVKNGMRDFGLAQPIDEQVLRAYNYQFGTHSQTVSYGEESVPNGFWQVNFANLGIYRQQDWVASIKGFNKYFWGTEIYSSSNRYGRYQSYGAIEVMYRGGAQFSKFKADGWDWNKVPGTTTKLLSWTDLEAASGRQDETTDSNFAASLRFGSKNNSYLDEKIEGNFGLFAMDFSQKQISSTHDSNFTFKKSVFCFDGKLICLGSGINSANGQIVTNLFQNSLSNTSESIYLNSDSLDAFPYNSTLADGKGNWLLDANQTGYFVNSSQPLVIDRKHQTSPSHTGNGSLSYGDFASAYLDHGTSPNEAGYEFVIIPKSTSTEMNAFSSTMTSTTTAFYEVLQKTNQAHIVRSNGIYGYAFFEDSSLSIDGPVVKNEGAALVMLESSQCTMNVSVVHPDLNFSEITGLSQTKSVVLTFKGKWSLDSNTGGTVNISETAEGTELTISLVNGTPTDITLNKCFENPDYPVVYYEDFRYDTGNNGFTKHIIDDGGFTTLDTNGNSVSSSKIIRRISDIPVAENTNNLYNPTEERDIFSRINSASTDGNSRDQKSISTWGHDADINYAVDAYTVFTTVDLTDENPRINPTDTRKYASFWTQRRYGDGDIAIVTLLVSTDYTGDPTTTNWTILPMYSGKLATTSDNAKYVKGVVDLTSYADSSGGNQVTLALRYQGSDTPYVKLTNRNGEFRLSDLKFFVSSDLLSEANEIISEDSIVVFPNPVHSTLNILILNKSVGISRLQLIDIYRLSSRDLLHQRRSLR
ncbi:MAG: chondroitinase family polysaccharide lyase, partial [Flavicella sp.]